MLFAPGRRQEFAAEALAEHLCILRSGEAEHHHVTVAVLELIWPGRSQFLGKPVDPDALRCAVQRVDGQCDVVRPPALKLIALVDNLTPPAGHSAASFGGVVMLEARGYPAQLRSTTG